REAAVRPVGRVGRARVCAFAGAAAGAQALCRHLQIEPGKISSDGAFTVEHAPCLGLCDRAPALLINEAAVGYVDPADAAAIYGMRGRQTASFVGGDICILTTNCASGHPTSLTHYQARPRYAQ